MININIISDSKEATLLVQDDHIAGNHKNKDLNPIEDVEGNFRN